MSGLEPILLGVLVAVAALSVLSRVIGVPYPILMVVGGLVLGMIPGAPQVVLDPDLVLVVFLPPLLYVGAFFASLRDLRRDARPITMLSVGLVVATAAAVGVAAHDLTGMPWAAAFTLGAIVSPTDPLAATQIMRRLGAPRRIATVLEGEGLINDATALVLYRAAVGAAVGGSFSLAQAGLRVLIAPVGGVLIGLAVGWIIAWVRKRIEDTPTEITISVFTGYAAFLPAAALGVSGVLATVTAGVYLGWRAPEIASPDARLQGFSFWTITQFLINATLFVLIGLQLPQILDALGDRSMGELLVDGAAISGVVIAVRIAWVFATTVVLRTPRPAVVTGRLARGLAAALPGRVDGHARRRSLAAAPRCRSAPTPVGPFPDRNRSSSSPFCVIMVAVVFQRLHAGLLGRSALLGVSVDDAVRPNGRVVRSTPACLPLIARRALLQDQEEPGGSRTRTRPETSDRMRSAFTPSASGDSPRAAWGRSTSPMSTRSSPSAYADAPSAARGARGPAPGRDRAPQPRRDLERF